MRTRRGAAARHGRSCQSVYARVGRGPARRERGHRGHGRHRSSSSSSTGASAARPPPSWTSSARQDEGHSRRRHRGARAARPARRPASRSRSSSSSFDPDRPRSTAARKVAERAARAARHPSTSTTACRCPASTGRLEVDKAEAAKYGVKPDDGRHGGPARHQRREAHGIPAGRRPTSRSTSWLRFPEDRRSLDQLDELRVNTPAGVGADRQLRRARAGADGRPHQPRRRRSASSPCTPNVAEGVQSADGAAGGRRRRSRGPTSAPA